MNQRLPISEMSAKSRAFSLLELLVVVAIMSVLAGFTLSSFSFLRSTSLTASGNQLVDVLAMARQNSITHNAYTAVVIDTQGAGAYNTYCLLQLTRQDNGTFGQWTPISSWHALGQGVVFENGQANDTFIGSSSPASLPQPFPTNFPVPIQGRSVLTSTTAYQCYQPDGTLVGGQALALRLRLIEGKVDPTSGTSIYQGATVSGQQVSYYDLIFISITGVTKIERP